MRTTVLASIAILLLVKAAPAQVLQFDAKLGDDGKVTLVPKASADNILPKSAEPPKPDNIYLWTSTAGVVKGIYASQSEALTQQLSSGDTIKALAAAPQLTVSSVSRPASYFKDIAQEAARQLLQSARDAACTLDPKPDTISPTVSVSFSALAGGSMSVSATWQTATLCKAP